MIDTVLFDFDGVISHTEPINFTCWKKAFTEYYDITLPDGDYRDIVGLRLEEILQYFMALTGSGDRLSTQNKHELLVLKNRHYFQLAETRLERASGLVSLLEHLQKYDYRLCVVSAAQESRLLLSLQTLKVDQYFEHVFPAPTDSVSLKSFQNAATLIPTNIQNCAVIEDSPAAIRIARDEGAGKIYALNSSHSASALKAAGADKVVSQLDQLIDEFSQEVSP